MTHHLTRPRKSGIGGLGLAAAALGLAAWAARTSRQAKAAERRHPPVGRFLAIDGVRLHYVERGAGPPVVLLHGNGSMIQEPILSGVVEGLAKDHRVIVFDRPGYGHSTRPRARLWTPAAQAGLFSKAFEALGLTKPLVLGHSWGTLVALALALDHPASVGALILASGYYHPTPRADVVLALPPAIPIVGDILRYTISPLLGWAMSDRLLAKVFAPQPVPARFVSGFPLSLGLRPLSLRASAEEAVMMIPAAALLRRRYHELRHPLLIVAGTDDRIVDTGRQSVRLHREMPESELLLYPGVGHMVLHAHPEAIASAVSALSTALPPQRTDKQWLSQHQHALVPVPAE